MRRIPLTQGQHAIVDEDDYAWLSLRKWCVLKGRNGCFYAVRHTSRKLGRRRRLLMHVAIARYIGLDTANQIDHRDGNGLNNVRTNLRAATHSQNQRNRRKGAGTTSKFKGVSWHGQNGRWQAFITVKGESRYLGCFDTEVEAARAYDAAARVAHKEFARLNFEADE